MSYHLTESDSYKAGDVIRLADVNGIAGPFMDCVILGFDKNGYAKLCRPFVYAHLVGTTGPTGLLGAEEFITMLDKTRDKIIQREKIT